MANSSCPPTFQLHGGMDLIVPVEQSELMHAALQKLGVESQLMTVANYVHGDYRFNRDEPAQRISAFLGGLV